MINTYIAQYKKYGIFEKTKENEHFAVQNELANDAFVAIYNELRQFIDYMSSRYKIPGLDRDDMHVLAIEQIHDCLCPRKLKRGTGEKIVLNENDSESKNFNSLKNAIKYRFIREKRKTETNIIYSYNIDILDDDGKIYNDREGQPLDIGINFVHGIAYLYSGNTRISPALNIPVVKNTRTAKSSLPSNPIDYSVSFDFTTETDDDDSCEIRDVLEFECDKNRPDELEVSLFKNNVLSKLGELQYHKKMLNVKPLTKEQIETINNLLTYSTNTNSLQQYVNKNKKAVNSIKEDLSRIFMSLGIIL